MPDHQIKRLTPETIAFPPVEEALIFPNGLLAIGGDLSVERLINAYRHGIFPWYSENEPILWWSPDPRAVLFPEQLHLSRSLRRTLNKKTYQVTVNKAFREVITECAKPRPGQPSTWILPEMIEAYCALHQAGYAQSIEVWQDKQLAGGIYGVKIGNIFSAESMFKRKPDASKIALVYLTQQLNYQLIDCQMMNPFLQTMGAIEIPRWQYLAYLVKSCYDTKR